MQKKKVNPKKKKVEGTKFAKKREGTKVAKKDSRPKAKKVYGLKKSLDDRERRFADELVSGKSIIQAALSAGYKLSTADKVAYKWIGETREDSTKPELFDYVEAKRKKLAAKYEITQEKVMAELGKLLFTSPKDLYNENGQLKAIHEMSDAEANLIAGFEMEEVSISKNVTSITKKVKIIKKTEAISIANRMMGYNSPDKMQHDLGPSFLEVLMKASAKKE